MRKTLLISLLSFLTVLRINAQPGSLDPSFGTTGHVALGTNYTITAFQPDGKLLAVLNVNGDIEVRRYNSNGALDPSFGINGKVVTDLGSTSDAIRAITVGGDGKIVVAGNSSLGMALAIVRYNTNGTLDNTFGTSGIVITPLNQFADAGDQIVKVAVQSDNKIFLLVQHNRRARYITMRRYNENGTTDNFGASIMGRGESTPKTLFIQKNGKVVIGGASSIIFLPDPNQLLVTRINSDGTTDVSFANEGILTSELSEIAIDINVQNDEKLIVAGTGKKLLRYNVNGVLDPTFGAGGVVTTAFDVNKIAIQIDGKILVAGSVTDNFAVARYNNDGTIDESFGTGGMATSDFGTNESISDMIIVNDRLSVYGSDIEAVYLLSQPIVAESIKTNTSNGSQALSSNTTGAANTAYGTAALQANTSGSGNTGIGYNSLYSNTAGNNNTTTGGAALALNTTGNNNAAFGVAAGFSHNNFSSTFIGTFADATNPVTNSTALGFQATVNASNQVRIGNSAVTSIGGFTNWTNVSDGRFKKNVNEDVPGLEFITRLRPVTYTLDLDQIDTKLKRNMASRVGAAAKSISILPPSAEEVKAKAAKAKVKYTGFVAQEVEQAAKKLNYEFSGVDVPASKEGYYGLRYAEFVVPLVKAVQEQQKQIEELKELVAKLMNGQAVVTNTNNTVVSLSGASIEQSFPNPNNGTTIVRYHLPGGTASAKVVISNMKGQLIKSIDLNSKGDGQLTLNTTTLAAGTYTYSLLVNGKETDTKKMVVTR